MSFDVDQALYERRNRLNQPDFAPGQSQSQGGNNMLNNSSGGSPWDDPFASLDSGDISQVGQLGGASDPFGGSGNIGGGFVDPFATPTQTGAGYNDPFGGVSGAFGAGAFGGQQQQPQQQQKSAEDAFFDATAKGAKASVGFIKELVKSFGNNTSLYWVNYGFKVAIASAVVIVLGIIAKLVLHYPAGLDVSIGAVFSAIVGVGCWLIPLDKARTCQSEYKNEDFEESEPEPQLNMMNMGADMLETPSSSLGNEDFFQPNDTLDFDIPTSDVSEFNLEEEEEEEEEEDVDWSTGSRPTEPVREMTPQEALASMPELDKGVYTRQFLYERFSTVLPSVNPNFDKVTTIDDEESEEFLRWTEMLREAAKVTGLDEEHLPELGEIKKNLFTVTLISDRPKGIKPDVVGEELAKLYSYNTYGEIKDNVYSKVDTIGTRCIFTIYTGQTAMVSLKDMMKKEEKFMLDTSNFMPVIFGINEVGKVIKADLKGVESIIIAGMPRSGKTWLAQAVLAQMCAFVPPTELQIYVCDPKGAVSDFRKFYLPHVKKFVSEDDKIIATLDYVINELAPKRKKLIGDAGYVNIWDYKKANPSVKIPSVIYIVMDELVTLAERMDKDTKSHFQKQLITIITQFPNLGIRVFLVPHVIKNDIISKTATDTVEARISVRGNAAHIEQTTGAKPNQFKYKIPNVGDMAVYIKQISQDVFYSHGTILTTSNPENNAVFDYLRQVWSKLEPDEVKGSRADVGAEEAQNEEILGNLENVDDTPLNFEDLSSKDSQVSSVFNSINENGLSSFNEDAVKNEYTDDDTDDFFDM